MKVIYFYKDEKIDCTNDFIPNIGDFIRIKGETYEIIDKRVHIEKETEFDIYLDKGDV